MDPPKLGSVGGWLRHTFVSMLSRLARTGLADPRQVWDRIPVPRRAAVLAILYKNLEDQLSCVVTVRSASISYGGDAALPGGKADFPEELPWDVARREAFEEINFPQTDVELSDRFGVAGLDQCVQLPAYLSSRFHAVVPCVGYLDIKREALHPYTGLPKFLSKGPWSPEVHHVFSVPLESILNPQKYRSRTEDWRGLKFPQHFIKLRARAKKLGEPAELLVWGLTANVLLDIASLVYGQSPSIPHRRSGQIDDQALIEALIDRGYFNADRGPKSIDFGIEFKDNALLESRQPEGWSPQH